MRFIFSSSKASIVFLFLMIVCPFAESSQERQVLQKEKSSTGYQAQIEKILLEIQNDLGIKIFYKDIPPSNGSIVAYSLAQPSDYPVLLGFLKLLQQELNRYPAEFFKNSPVQAIVLVKKHFFNEKPAEGVYTNLADVIMLDFYRDRRNPMDQRHSIHHELFHRIEFQEKKKGQAWDAQWSALNAAGFQYGTEKQTGAGIPLDYLAPPVPGFATDYALTSPVEDRAEIFACLMVEPQNKLVHRWAKKDKALAKKIEYILSYVQDYSSSMGDAFWYKLFY